MQIPAAQKASLGRMRMYPTADHQVLAVDIVEQFGFSYVGRLARVTRCGLVRDDEMRYEKRIRDESAAEDAAGFEI